MKTSRAASACSGARGEQEAEARERPQPALDRDAVGARQAVDVEHRAAARGLEHLQQRAGRAGHRDVARGVAQPCLGDLDERVAVRRAAARARGRAASVKKSLSSLMYRPSRQNAASRTSPGLAAAARSGRRAMPVHVADSDAAPADRQVPADDLDAEQLGRPREPFEDERGMSLVGADEHVEDRERPAAHGAHVGDVRDDGRRRPAARGCAATYDGSIASPQSTIHSSPWAISAPSSPSPTGPSRRTSCRSRLACRAGRSRIAAARAWASDIGATLRQLGIGGWT